MRWHHVADYLTVLGSLALPDHTARAHTPAEVTQAVANGKAAELFDSEQDGQAQSSGWTRPPTTCSTRAAARSGSRTVPRSHLASGTTTGRWPRPGAGARHRHRVGRLAQAGAVFVPEREARSWHLGLSQLENRNEEGHRYRARSSGSACRCCRTSGRGRPAVGGALCRGRRRRRGGHVRGREGDRRWRPDRHDERRRRDAGGAVVDADRRAALPARRPGARPAPAARGLRRRGRVRYVESMPEHATGAIPFPLPGRRRASPGRAASPA